MATRFPESRLVHRANLVAQRHAVLGQSTLALGNQDCDWVRLGDMFRPFHRHHDGHRGVTIANVVLHHQAGPRFLDLMTNGRIEAYIEDVAPQAFPRHLESLVVHGGELLRNSAVEGRIGHIPGSQFLLQPLAL